MNKFFLLFITAILLVSCKTYNDEEIDEFDVKIQNYIRKNKIKVTPSGSGLYYRIDEEGDGEFIQAKDSVYVSFKGQLIDGTVFDNHKKPVKLRVEELIAGWKEVLYKMKEGGKAYLIVPPQLGYGDQKMNDIPQNSILVYSLFVEKVI